MSMNNYDIENDIDELKNNNLDENTKISKEEDLIKELDNFKKNANVDVSSSESESEEEKEKYVLTFDDFEEKFADTNKEEKIDLICSVNTMNMKDLMVTLTKTLAFMSDLKKEMVSLEANNAELTGKLKDNSQEKIKSDNEFKKAFDVCEKQNATLKSFKGIVKTLKKENKKLENELNLTKHNNSSKKASILNSYLNYNRPKTENLNNQSNNTKISKTSNGSEKNEKLSKEAIHGNNQAITMSKCM